MAHFVSRRAHFLRFYLHVLLCCYVLLCAAMCCYVLLCAAMYCYVLCAAMCLHDVALHWQQWVMFSPDPAESTGWPVIVGHATFPSSSTVAVSPSGLDSDTGALVTVDMMSWISSQYSPSLAVDCNVGRDNQPLSPLAAFEAELRGECCLVHQYMYSIDMYRISICTALTCSICTALTCTASVYVQH